MQFLLIFDSMKSAGKGVRGIFETVEALKVSNFKLATGRRTKRNIWNCRSGAFARKLFVEKLASKAYAILGFLPREAV